MRQVGTRDRMTSAEKKTSADRHGRAEETRTLQWKTLECECDADGRADCCSVLRLSLIPSLVCRCCVRVGRQGIVRVSA